MTVDHSDRSPGEQVSPICGCRLAKECNGSAGCQRAHWMPRISNRISELQCYGKQIQEIALLVRDEHNKTHPSTISRLSHGSDAAPLALDKLPNIEARLAVAVQQTRDEHFEMMAKSFKLAVRPLQFCASVTVCESMATEVGDVMLWNTCSAVLQRDPKTKKRLPKTIEGVFSQLGDPDFGLWLFQIDAPENSHRDTLIAHKRRMIHEVEHLLEQLNGDLRGLGVKPPKRPRNKRRRIS